MTKGSRDGHHAPWPREGSPASRPNTQGTCLCRPNRSRRSWRSSLRILRLAPGPSSPNDPGRYSCRRGGESTCFHCRSGGRRRATRCPSRRLRRTKRAVRAEGGFRLRRSSCSASSVSWLPGASCRRGTRRVWRRRKPPPGIRRRILRRRHQYPRLLRVRPTVSPRRGRRLRRARESRNRLCQGRRRPRRVVTCSRTGRGFCRWTGPADRSSSCGSCFHARALSSCAPSSSTRTVGFAPAASPVSELASRLCSPAESPR